MAKNGYKIANGGLKELGRLAGVQTECLRAAEKIAAAANQDDPTGRYRAETALVPSGWQQDDRAGARVKETKRGRGGLRRTLVRVTP